MSRTDLMACGRAEADNPAIAAGRSTEVARLARLIADPRRVEILGLVADGTRNVGAVAAAMAMSQPAASHLLMMFRMAGAIRAKREGKESFYQLTDEGRRLVAAVAALAQV